MGQTGVRAEWKSAMPTPGAPCVTTAGPSRMPTWSAGSLAVAGPCLPSWGPDSAPGQAAFSWTGSESSLAQCPHSGWFTHNCGHHEDAGVVCSGEHRCLLGQAQSCPGQAWNFHIESGIPPCLQPFTVLQMADFYSNSEKYASCLIYGRTPSSLSVCKD